MTRPFVRNVKKDTIYGINMDNFVYSVRHYNRIVSADFREEIMNGDLAERVETHRDDHDFGPFYNIYQLQQIYLRMFNDPVTLGVSLKYFGVKLF